MTFREPKMLTNLKPFMPQINPNEMRNSNRPFRIPNRCVQTLLILFTKEMKHIKRTLSKYKQAR